jgi:PqqD family protein of HPr-rel-A system
MAPDSVHPVPTLWRRLSGSDLHWRFLDEQYVVYNNGSGYTHVLDPLSALLIQQLTERGCTATELIKGVGVLLNLEATDPLLTNLPQTLGQLAELGLIEFANP